MLYLYDDKGKIYGISVNDQIYCFMENVQGDVIGLYDYYGKVCARYTYDPWGNIIGVQELDTVTFGEDNKKIGEVNPFRYRGYYYDMETGFYYLNSRYYDPQVKRFINADAYASTGQGFNGTNMFCYCGNNPVGYADYNGEKIMYIRGYNVNSYIWADNVARYGSIEAMNRLLANPDSFIGRPLNNLCSAVGTAILTNLDCKIAAGMYNNGLYGNGQSINPDLQYQLSIAIENTDEYQSGISNALKNLKNYEYTHQEIFSVEVGEQDLYYSIQHMTFTVDAIHTSSGWKINVFGTDTYDFTELRLINGVSFGNAANDFGVLLQNLGIMIPYEVEVEYKYVC